MLGHLAVSWKSKKQEVVARSFTEVEYKAMARTCCEVVWLLQLFKDLGVHKLTPTHLEFDNKFVIHIVANPVFYERTKHIEVTVICARTLTVKGDQAKLHSHQVTTS